MLLPDDDLTGTVLDNTYEVRSRLGMGGMGVVYKARQRYVDRDVAVKVLRREMAGDETAVRRFLLEAKAAARLKNPHTVILHHFGVTPDGRMYFVMELLEGRSLASLLAQERTISWRRALDIVAQACESLAEAHANGIWHRDIKPENLFLCDTGSTAWNVKVLDFGIAWMVQTAQGVRLTKSGMVCGTPEYISPEQAAGAALDGRTDIYSLGIVLYEMLAGVPPFVGDAPVSLLYRHIKDAPRPVCEANPGAGIQRAVQSLVSSMLAKSPADRPPSAEVVRKAVAGILAREDGTAAGKAPTHRIHEADTEPTTDPGSDGRAPVLAPGRRGVFIGFGLAVVVAAAAGAVLYSLSDRPALSPSATGQTSPQGGSENGGRVQDVPAAAQGTASSSRDDAALADDVVLSAPTAREPDVTVSAPSRLADAIGPAADASTLPAQAATTQVGTPDASSAPAAPAPGTDNGSPTSAAVPEPGASSASRAANCPDPRELCPRTAERPTQDRATTPPTSQTGEPGSGGPQAASDAPESGGPQPASDLPGTSGSQAASEAAAGPTTAATEDATKPAPPAPEASASPPPSPGEFEEIPPAPVKNDEFEEIPR